MLNANWGTPRRLRATHFLGKSQPTGMKTVKTFIILCRTVTYVVPQHLNCINKDTVERHYSTSVWASKLRQQNQRSSLSGFVLNLCVKVAKSHRELICLLYFVYLLLHQAQINGNPSVTCSTTSPRTSHLENWRTHKSYNELPPSSTPTPILSLKAGAVKLGRAQVFCLKAFTPQGAPLIIFLQ